MDNELHFAQERLAGRRELKREPVDYSEMARAIVAQARRTGVLELKRERATAHDTEQRTAKVETYLRNLRRVLPEHYKHYTDTPPPKHAGNLRARQAIQSFALGDALHLYGPAGTSKSHCAVWLAAELIRTRAVGVRYYHVSGLIQAFRDFGNEPNLLGPDVLLIDDVDKGSVTEHNRMTIWKIYERLEDAKSLITTANRDSFDLAAYWFSDPANAAALSSRMSLMTEIEVTGEDYRPKMKESR